MPGIEPIYTPRNCNPAYQLNWGLTLFWRQVQTVSDWLEALKQCIENDGVRLLKHQFREEGVSQFLLSTKPHVAPAEVIRSVKGRLQYLVRGAYPTAFQRNYSLRSVGSATRRAVEHYLAQQTIACGEAGSPLEREFRQWQIHRPEVDLSKSRESAHGQYWYNLHVVLVNEARGREFRGSVLGKMRDAILGTADKHGHLLSRGAILPDHVHLALGCPPGESPLSVALRYMNNAAYVVGMRPLFQCGFYVGTFGEYDRRAIS